MINRIKVFKLLIFVETVDNIKITIFLILDIDKMQKKRFKKTISWFIILNILFISIFIWYYDCGLLNGYDFLWCSWYYFCFFYLILIATQIRVFDCSVKYFFYFLLPIVLSTVVCMWFNPICIYYWITWQKFTSFLAV